jgi:hypothetical protein
MKKTALCLVLFLHLISCQTEREVPVTIDPTSVKYMHQLESSMNDIIVYDIFSAPVASRIYAYSSLAAFEAVRWIDPSYPSMTKQLNGFAKMPVPERGKEYDFRISAVRAFFNIAQKLTFTKDSVVTVQERILNELKGPSSEEIYERSISFGEQVADSIMASAAKDHYKQIQGMPRYTLRDEDGRWKTTPPDYLDAVQSFWNKMSPMVMDSASQFKPVPPPSYSLDKNSQYYKEVEEVYKISLKLNDSTKEVAQFWDDNASATTHVGHLMFATKKPSPGGHWINITAIASKKANQDWVQAAQSYALVAVAMYDGFISCWDEKFRSEFIRPVTAINDMIDPKWESYLQTPPFPEYTSGHSVISSSIATVLTRIFGENFAFTDDYEKPYIGLQRSFPSFLKASEEACISRMYGGIHFRSSVENGRKQGLALGNYINEKIKLK